MSRLVIEHASDRDWQRVRTLRLAALRDTPDAFCSSFEFENAQAPQWWQGRLCSAMTTTLLAVRDEDAGMCVVAKEPDKSDAWLSAVWVVPEHRGHGVGDALMQAALDHARSLGARRLMLEVAETNLAAQTLYQRHGFARTGRLTTLPPPRESIIEVEFASSLD